MKAIFSYFQRVLAIFASFWPQKLPSGKGDFEAFASKIIRTYDFPDNDSFRNMIAGMIQHAGQSVDRIPPRYFAKRIRKAVANEVAFYVMQEIKEKRKLEETKKTKVEAATPPTLEAVVSNAGKETLQLQGV